MALTALGRSALEFRKSVMRRPSWTRRRSRLLQSSCAHNRRLCANGVVSRSRPISNLCYIQEQSEHFEKSIKRSSGLGGKFVLQFMRTQVTDAKSRRELSAKQAEVRESPGAPTTKTKQRIKERT